MRVNKEALGYVAGKNLLARSADFEAVNVTSVLDVELIKRASVSTYRR